MEFVRNRATLRGGGTDAEDLLLLREGGAITHMSEAEGGPGEGLHCNLVNHLTVGRREYEIWDSSKSR